ncbi:MAG: ribonuclease III family protein [Armatimonadota bacterium]
MTETTALIDGFASKWGIPAGDSLLIQAFTHRSAASDTLPSYERLEYLGDAVIRLWTARQLFERTPEDGAAKELNRREQVMVNRTSLAGAARRIGLTTMVIAGKSEIEDGRTSDDRIAEELFEAVAAVVYLRCGWDVLNDYLGFAIGEQLALVLAGEGLPDAKSDLQMRTQARYRCLPEYRVVSGSGDGRSAHFDVELLIQGCVVSRGAGHGRRAAEMAAAIKALACEDGWPLPALEESDAVIR